MRKPLAVLLLTALLGLGLAGCSGDDGAQGPPGPQGPAGPPGPPGPGASTAVDVTTLTPEQLAALQINGTVDSVAIASPPVVEFTLKDGQGNAIVGMTTSQIRFTIAKLDPGENGSADHWVNYIVTDSAGAPSRPNAERDGTFVDNGDGSYTYTFKRDIKTIADQVAAAPVDTDALGDLTYDPSLQHRVVIQISGSVNGASLGNPANLAYDWVPATGATIAKADQQKYVVDISSCNACHDKLAIHGGGRIDTQYCTTCHTTQRAFGRDDVASANFAFPALTETKTVNATTGITSYSYSPNLYVGDGEVLGNFVATVHKIHNGNALVKSNYNYAGIVFDLKAFSMLDNGQRMCTVCHDPAVAPKAGLAYSKPTREACGACHDGINFATGTGTTINGNTGGHIGRAQADDSACVLCHSAAATRIDHRTVNVTKHNPEVTDGLVSFSYLIDSATVDASGNAKIVFAIQQQTAPSTTKTFATLPLSANFTGGPSFLLPFAVAQDGVAMPADYNNAGSGQANAQPRSVSLASLISGGRVVPSTSKTGYYEATIANAFPAGAMMRTVVLQGYWTQVSPAAARHAISVVKTVTGDTARRKVVDARNCANCHEWFEGHGGNRVIGVETGNGELVCMACHVPNMTSGGHTLPDAVWSAKNAANSWTDSQLAILGEWGVNMTLTPETALQLPVTSNNMKDMIHGIHAGRDRVNPWRDARNFRDNLTLLDFRRMDFPGTLNNCAMCHGVGTGFNAYNAVPTNALMSNHYFRSDAFVSTPTVPLATSSRDGINNQDSVVTPFAAACVSCHDSTSAQGHMQTNGARLFVPRSQAAGVQEACQVCHGPGAEWDAAVVHR
jgi:OmcA/MtrC family decaheme c-type cytochrome